MFYLYMGAARTRNVYMTYNCGIAPGEHTHFGCSRVMEEELRRVSRLQMKAAYDVVIQRYDYLVGHVNPMHIFPHLVSSKLVEQDFRQYLDGERTDKGKMRAVLRELITSPMEGWFKDFIGALSKFPQYKVVVDTLLTGNSRPLTHHTHTCCQIARRNPSLCRLYQSH